jgi:DNA-binding transcriptional ArsR family regulator
LRLAAGRSQSVAFLSKGLSDENRLRILLCLSAQTQSVSGIVEELGLSQPLVSHHLKELKRCLLVTVERSGPFIYYGLRPAGAGCDPAVGLHRGGPDRHTQNHLTPGEDHRSEMETLADTIQRMDPEKALDEIGRAMKSLFSVVSEDSRGRFLLNLVGDSQNDKLSSLVHL